MTASIGIWAQGDPTGESVLYRWEAYQQTGFVTLEVPTRRFRPADESLRHLQPLATVSPVLGCDIGFSIGTRQSASDLQKYR